VPKWVTEQPAGYTAQIHQATGMISVQLGVDQASALIRLRARAFSQRRDLADVAADVVARRLRFSKDEE
jgi:AmiR/NasT family two-component response regulator